MKSRLIPCVPTNETKQNPSMRARLSHRFYTAQRFVQLINKWDALNYCRAPYTNFHGKLPGEGFCRSSVCYLFCRLLAVVGGCDSPIGPGFQGWQSSQRSCTSSADCFGKLTSIACVQLLEQLFSAAISQQGFLALCCTCVSQLLFILYQSLYQPHRILHKYSPPNPRSFYAIGFPGSGALEVPLRSLPGNMPSEPSVANVNEFIEFTGADRSIAVRFLNVRYRDALPRPWC